MREIYESVCAWNAARYDQEFDKALTISLLREEYEEFLQAVEEVDQLDGLCDVIYVAMGGLWKLDTPQSVHEVCADSAVGLLQDLINLNEVNPAFFISTFLDTYEYATYPAAQAFYNIVIAAVTQIRGMGIIPEEALQIVCEANDSKVAKKTDSSVKANIDKGTNFVAPEPKLQALLDARHG